VHHALGRRGNRGRVGAPVAAAGQQVQPDQRGRDKARNVTVDPHVVPCELSASASRGADAATSVVATAGLGSRRSSHTSAPRPNTIIPTLSHWPRLRPITRSIPSSGTRQSSVITRNTP